MRGNTLSLVRMTWLSVPLLVLGAPSVFMHAAFAQAEYRSAREAYGAGAKLFRDRKYDEGRVPFEAALRLSDDLEMKVKIYGALMQSYRQLAEIDKMLEATDFIFEQAESTLEKARVARSLASFAHQRGKAPEIVRLYEGKLQENPKHKPALYTLTEIYRRAEPNPTRREELLTTLAEIEKGDANGRAEKFEKLAAQQPDQAAWNWKEAAATWLQAGHPLKALEAANRADVVGPERRSDQLAHFWHKAMGDIYLQLDVPRQAIPHFEQAIQKTNIAGYIKACQDQLNKARTAGNSQP